MRSVGGVLAEHMWMATREILGWSLGLFALHKPKPLPSSNSNCASGESSSNGVAQDNDFQAWLSTTTWSSVIAATWSPCPQGAEGLETWCMGLLIQARIAMAEFLSAAVTRFLVCTVVVAVVAVIIVVVIVVVVCFVVCLYIPCPGVTSHWINLIDLDLFEKK